MSRRPTFYLTTAIAYANNRPGLHTLLEVFGADVLARWHRMLGDDTRFLTGTDEHSVNIAMRAAEEGARPGRSSTSRSSATSSPSRPSGSPRTGSSGRPIPTTPGRPRRWSAGRTPTATSTSGRTRAGTARTRASAPRPTSTRRPAGRSARTIPTSRSSGSPSGTGSSGCRPTRSGSSATSPTTRTSSSPRPGATRCSASSARASRTSRSAGRAAAGGSRSRSRENGETAQREDGSLGSRGRHDLRLVRRAHQLHHRAPASRTIPTRSRAGGRPTSTSSARTSPGSTRSTGRRCSGAPGSRPRSGSGSTAGCSRPAASG